MQIQTEWMPLANDTAAGHAIGLTGVNTLKVHDS